MGDQTIQIANPVPHGRHDRSIIVCSHPLAQGQCGRPVFRHSFSSEVPRKHTTRVSSQSHTCKYTRCTAHEFRSGLATGRISSLLFGNPGYRSWEMKAVAIRPGVVDAVDVDGDARNPHQDFSLCPSLPHPLHQSWSNSNVASLLLCCSAVSSSYLEEVFAYCPGFPTAVPLHRSDCCVSEYLTLDLACESVTNIWIILL